MLVKLTFERSDQFSEVSSFLNEENESDSRALEAQRLFTMEALSRLGRTLRRVVGRIAPEWGAVLDRTTWFVKKATPPNARTGPSAGILRHGAEVPDPVQLSIPEQLDSKSQAKDAAPQAAAEPATARESDPVDPRTISLATALATIAARPRARKKVSDTMQVGNVAVSR